MILAEVISKAVIENDAELAGKIAFRLQIHGFTNDDIYAIFKRNVPDPERFGRGEFESLMFEADTVEESAS